MSALLGQGAVEFVAVGEIELRDAHGIRGKGRHGSRCLEGGESAAQGLLDDGCKGLALLGGAALELAHEFIREAHGGSSVHAYDHIVCVRVWQSVSRLSQRTWADVFAAG